jgi:hypothetical protein
MAQEQSIDLRENFNLQGFPRILGTAQTRQAKKEKKPHSP